MHEPESPDEIARRRPNRQMTVFMVGGIAVAGAIYTLSRSFTGVEPVYEAGPVPQLQETWQLLLPADDATIDEGSGGPVRSWTIDYGRGTAERLRDVSDGPDVREVTQGPLADCSMLGLRLEQTGSPVSCEDELLGRWSAHAWSDAGELWVVWEEGRIHLVEVSAGG